MINSIESLCRAHVGKVSAELKKNGRNSLGMLKTKDDEEADKYPPSMFVKLLTKFNHKPVIIETRFKKHVKGKLVDVNPMDYVRKRCNAIAVFKVDNIFIGSSLQSIQTRMSEALVVREIKRQSTFEDLDLKLLSLDDEKEDIDDENSEDGDDDEEFCGLLNQP